MGYHVITHFRRGAFLATVSLGMLVSCGHATTFKGPGSGAGAEASALGVRINCGQTKVQIDKKALIAAGGKIQLSGELCPQISSSVELLFVLDFSDSMQVSDPLIGSGATGSCGRSKAVSAIVEKMTASRGKDDKVSAGIIGFGTKASEVTGEVDLAQFKPSVDALCRNNGGVTNYKEAFELAGQKLSASAKAVKIMYFISDGLPTAGGLTMNEDAHFMAGSDAAAVLRSQFPGLVFNAMLLQSSALSFPYDPAIYLTQLTADASRVRIVSQANQLAESAVQLLTVPVSLDAGKVAASVSDDGSAKQSLTIRQLLESQDSKGKWIFGTSEFDGAKIAGTDFLKTIHFVMEASEMSGRKQSLAVNLEIK